MDDSSVRDHLALERTHLANERKALAYLRTALAFVAAGAAILHFYAGHTLLATSAWLLIASGAGIALWGGKRFLGVRRRLQG